MALDTIIFSNMNQLVLVEFVHENLKYEQYHMTLIVDNGKDKENNNAKLNNNSIEKKERSLLRTLTVMIIAVAAVLIASSLIAQLIEPRYGPFIKVAVAAIIGYFVINSLANVFYRLSYDALKKNAEIIRILIRIIGAIIVISIIIIFDIGLLFSRLKTDEGDIILAPNLSLVSTTIIIRDSKSV